MAGVMDTLDRLEDLPTLPESLVRIPPMLQSGEYDTAAVHDLIRRDEALALAVLRRANSSMYNASGSVFDLEKSIVRLGSKELMKIVTAAGANKLLRDAGAAYGLRRGHLARSAAGGAAVASTLARQLGTADPEMAYTGALLRDVGKIVMDLHCMNSGAELDDPAETSDGISICFLTLEQDRFGTDHAAVGRELASRWGLPAPIPDTIGFHHEPPEPDSDAHDALFDIVHAADIITLWAGLAIGTDGLAYRIAQHVRDGILSERDRNEALISMAWEEASAFEHETNDSKPSGEVPA